MKREPVLSASTITAIVAAGLALAAAFGLHLSKEQTAAIMGAVALLAPIVAGFISRQFVTPVKGAVHINALPNSEPFHEGIKKAADRDSHGRFSKHGPDTTPFTGSH